MSDSSTSGQRDGTSGNGRSESDVESALRRRGLLATAATIGALSSAGCLGVLSERSETGPRSDDPTPAGTQTTTGSETTTGTPQPTQRYDIEFLDQGATIDVPGDEALLYAGLDEGWDLPYQCEHGVCGQCTAKVDGDGTELVSHDGNRYLSEEQVEAGFVLTCVGYPEADFSIETDMKDEADQV